MIRRTSYLLMVLILVAITTPALCAERFAICLGGDPFLNDEKIVGFELKIVSGGISSLVSVPMGWNISIDNDPSWKTGVAGSVLVGAASLNINEFNNIFVVEKNELMGIKFNVEIDIIVTVTKDFDKTKTVHFELKDLILRKKDS